ncbi:unnamed protein product, partial [Urochloa humidicola]
AAQPRASQRPPPLDIFYAALFPTPSLTHIYSMADMQDRRSSAASRSNQSATDPGNTAWRPLCPPRSTSQRRLSHGLDDCPSMMRIDKVLIEMRALTNNSLWRRGQAAHRSTSEFSCAK